MNISLSPFTPENLVPRDRFGSPVPRQPAHLHTQAESGVYLRDSSRFPRRRPFIYLYRQSPSDQSRVYQVTQWRTDGVHCRESAGTGPLVLKIVPIKGAAFSGITMDQLMRASRFPHPPSVCSGYINSHSMFDTESIEGCYGGWWKCILFSKKSS